MKFPVFTHILSLVAIATLSPLSARADAEPEGTPIFSLSSNDAMWEKNEDVSKEMISLQEAGGTKWKTHAFKHLKEYSSGLFCGLKGTGHTATITSIDPVADKIEIVSAYIYNKNPEYLESVELWASPSSKFPDASTQKISQPIHSLPHDFWNFTIPEPAADLYYQLRISFKDHEYDWIRVDWINFYAPETPQIPIVEDTRTTDGTFTISSNSGELHLVADVFAPYNVFVRNFEPQNNNVSWIWFAPDNWRNKVADKNKKYKITPLNDPENPLHMISIRAKSVNGDKESAEVEAKLHSTGILTGIDDIPAVDATPASLPVYYNLQGQKIDNPTHGVYIRLTDGRAEKVRL